MRAFLVRSQVYAIAFNNPFGDRVVTGSFDKTARLWDANTGQCLHILKGVAPGSIDPLMHVVYAAQSAYVCCVQLNIVPRGCNCCHTCAA